MLMGWHYQNAYVTRDIERAIEGFRSRGDNPGATSFQAEVDVTTPSGDGRTVSRLAFIWINNLQYELIQPISGPNAVFTDWLPADDSLRFHHICMRVEDWGEFEAHAAREKLKIVMRGGSERLRFVYVDAVAELGHYLEYVWMTPQTWTLIGGPPPAAAGNAATV